MEPHPSGNKENPMKFDAFKLNPQIMSNLGTMGFRRPTDIQYKALPAIMQGDDVLAIAQTGTGKTAAFAIPAIHNLLRTSRKANYDGVRCLIMEPTHELSAQTGAVVEQIAMKTGLTSLFIHGGTDQKPQIDKLKKGVDILIATPGRLFDLIHQGYVRTFGTEILILDEADHMLDLGFIDDIRQIVRYLPRRRQTLFFSATIDEKIKRLAYSLVYKPVHIRISPKNMVAKNVTHSVVSVPMDQKRYFLERIYNENPQSRFIVFVRTRVRAERVLAAMKRVDIEAVSMHGDKSQNERTSALETFRSDKVRMLIATDVSARGIDLPQVDYVVNYDVPDVPENYIHRVGRTGRGMNKGFAVTFFAPEEQEYLDAIQEYVGEEIDVIEMSESDREATIDFSQDSAFDWKSMLADEMEKAENVNRKGRR